MARRPTPADAALGWLTTEQACDHWQTSGRRLRKWRDAGLLEHRYDDKGRVLHRAAVPTDSTESPRLSGDSHPPRPVPPDPADSSSGSLDGGAVEDTPADAPEALPAHIIEALSAPGRVDYHGWSYDPRTREVAVSIRHNASLLIRDRTWLEDLWRYYVSGAQINEVCRRFTITRPTFEDLKRTLGLTKTSAPFTPLELRERMAEGSTDELVQQVMLLEEERILTRASRRVWAETAAKAAKWDAGPGAVLADLRDGLMDWRARPIPGPRPVRSRRVLVEPLADLHVGKRTHGKPGHLDAQEAALTRLALDALAMGLEMGNPELIIIPIGNDQLHVDNEAQTTTRGTHQGAQSTGSTRQMWRALCRILARVIEAAAAEAPVWAPWVPGNHDSMLSFTAAAAMAERFEATRHLEVDLAEAKRKSRVLWGEVPLMFDHGEKIKPAAWPALLAQECRGADVDKGVVFVGHLHHERQATVHLDTTLRTRIVTMAAPPAPDDWHHEHGYISRCETPIYQVDEQGLRVSAWVPLGA